MADNNKICVAMSGGVDSSTAAALLLKEGYDCRGVFMITHDDCGGEQRDAESVAALLGIEIDILDLREKFNDVLDYFCSEYKNARTPNPCVYCNRVMKFGLLWQHAQSKGCGKIATGHYIRQKNGRIYVGSDAKKEQSYILAMIERQVISHTLFPTGEYSKEQIREIAESLNLGVHSKPDSQEICFIPNDDYIGCLERLAPEIAKKGDILYIDGRKLGEHQGIHRYTIGQRRGLKVAMGEPVYVVALNAAENTVTLGPKSFLFSKVFYTSNANWLIEPIENEFDAIVKIRYNNIGTPAKVSKFNDGFKVVFDKPVSAITPGQTAAIYIEDDYGTALAAGGWIERTQPLE